MTEFLGNSLFFGVGVSLIAYEVGLLLRRKFALAILNPLLIAIVCVILFNKALGIPYDVEVMEGHTGTNGWEMQISREGVATSVLSLPLKYMHSPIEVLSLSDMEQVARLLAAFAESLGEEAGAQ